MRPPAPGTTCGCASWCRPTARRSTEFISCRRRWATRTSLLPLNHHLGPEICALSSRELASGDVEITFASVIEKQHFAAQAPEHLARLGQQGMFTGLQLIPKLCRVLVQAIPTRGIVMASLKDRRDPDPSHPAREPAHPARPGHNRHRLGELHQQQATPCRPRHLFAPARRGQPAARVRPHLRRQIQSGAGVPSRDDRAAVHKLRRAGPPRGNVRKLAAVLSVRGSAPREELHREAIPQVCALRRGSPGQAPPVSCQGAIRGGLARGADCDAGPLRDGAAGTRGEE